MPLLTSCRLCSSSNVRPRYVLDRYGLTVLQCDACSLRFVGDDLSDEEVNELYDRPGLAEYFIALGSRHEHKFAPRLMEFRRMGIPTASRVVDVGCGTGEFAAMAAAAGYDAVGIDVSVPSIEAARQLHPDADFRICDAAELGASEPASADVVTLWDVIEHVLHPHDVIAGCAAILRPGGLVVLGTPNGDSIFDRLADVLYRVARPPGRWMLEQRYSRWHLQIWTTRTMVRLLREHDFEIVEARRHRELTAQLSLYVRQAGFKKLARVAALADPVLEAAWPVRNKLTVYARKT